MKKLLYVFLALILLLVTVPTFIDWSHFKAPIIAAVKDNTGFEIDLKGSVNLSLLPSPHLSVKDISIKNKPGGKEATFVELKSISLGVNIFPLLRGHIEVSKVEFIEPVIHLETFKNGENNWDVKTEKTSSEIKATQAQSKSEISAPALSLQNVVIKDGFVTISDLKANSHQEIKNINLQGSLDSLMGPFVVKGQLDINDYSLKIEAETGEISGHKPSVVNANVSAVKGKDDYGTLQIKGTVQDKKFVGGIQSDALKIPFVLDLPHKKIDLQKGVKLTAQVEADSDNIKISSLAIQIESVKITGQASYKAPQVDVKLAIAEGDLKLNAAVSVKLGETRPHINADVSLNKLDLNAGTGTDQKASQPAASAPAANSNVPASARWSKDKWNLEPLKAVNGDFKFSVGEVKYDEYQLNQLNGTLHLKDGNLQLSSFQAQGYNGHLSGDVAVQQEKTPSVKLNFGIQNLNLASLPKVRQTPLKKATLNTSLKLSATGDNTFDAVNSLSGNMQFNLSQGVIEAFDIKKFVTDLKQIKSPGDIKTLMDDLKRKAESSFTHIKADFTVQNGKANSQNIEFLSDDATISGKGTIDLPGWMVDMNTQIKMKELGKLPPLGMKISGSIDAPSYAIDQDLLVKVLFQEAANRVLDKAVGSIGGKVGEILQGVLGAGKNKEKAPAAEGQQQPEKKQDLPINPEKLLKGLFGR